MADPPRFPIPCVGVEAKGSKDNEPSPACHAANQPMSVGETDSGEMFLSLNFAEKEGFVCNAGAGFNGRVNAFTRVDSARPVADQ